MTTSFHHLDPWKNLTKYYMHYKVLQRTLGLLAIILSLGPFYFQNILNKCLFFCDAVDEVKLSVEGQPEVFGKLFVYGEP